MKSTNPVRATTLEVVKRAKHVKINRRKIKEFVGRFGGITMRKFGLPAHINDIRDLKKRLDFIILIDALNFCFWPDHNKRKWNISYHGKYYDGSYALAFSLKKFFENNPDVRLDYFERITFDEFKTIFHGRGELLFLKKRWQIARRVAREIRIKYGDAKTMVLSCDKQCSFLVLKIAALPSFEDATFYRGKKVIIWKRAQLLASDINRAFGGKGLGELYDMKYLTAFADYKLPQVLQQYGILEYAPALEKKIAAKRLIKVGSEEETEMRAAIIWAVEYLVKEFKKNGVRIDAFEADWLLWNMSKKIAAKLPHPRVKTIFY